MGLRRYYDQAKEVVSNAAENPVSYLLPTSLTPTLVGVDAATSGMHGDGGGGSTSGVPTGTQGLIDIIKEILSQTRQDTDLVMPTILASAGYKIATDESGKQSVVRMTEEERLANMTEQERQQYELQGQLLERQKLALEGKLPLPAGVEQALQKQEEEMMARQRQLHGVAPERSTAGIQSIAELGANRASIEDAFRRGETQLGMGLLSQNQGMIGSTNQYNTQALGGYAGRYGGLINPYQNLMMPYENAATRAANMQAAKMQADATERAALYGLLGTGIGAGITGLLG